MIWYGRNSLVHKSNWIDVQSWALRTTMKVNMILDPKFKLLIIDDEGRFSWEGSDEAISTINCDA